MLTIQQYDVSFTSPPKTKAEERNREDSMVILSCGSGGATKSSLRVVAEPLGVRCGRVKYRRRFEGFVFSVHGNRRGLVQNCGDIGLREFVVRVGGFKSLIENLRTIDACNYDRGRKVRAYWRHSSEVTVLLVRICESPIDFIPSTAICLETRTARHFSQSCGNARP